MQTQQICRNEAYVNPPGSKKPVSKRVAYHWNEPGETGVFKMIDKTELHIPIESYQRDVTSKAKLLKVAKNWDWKSFGAISVIKRKDGTYSVFDGGHRTRAALKRDDISKLPCLVFEAEGHDKTANIKNEAKSFININTTKSNVSSFDLHRAGVIAEDKLDLAAKALIDKIGYKVKKDGSSKYGIAAIGTVKYMIKRSPENADKIMIILAQIADGAPIPATVMKGFFYLAEREINFDERSIANKLKKMDIAIIASAIQRESAIMGKGGERVCAKAVLDMINKGRRSKIPMSF